MIISGKEIDRTPVICTKYGECVYTKIELSPAELAEQMIEEDWNKVWLEIKPFKCSHCGKKYKGIHFCGVKPTPKPQPSVPDEIYLNPAGKNHWKHLQDKINEILKYLKEKGE